jgi:hypothetical protein
MSFPDIASRFKTFVDSGSRDPGIEQAIGGVLEILHKWPASIAKSILVARLVGYPKVQPTRPVSGQGGQKKAEQCFCSL